MQRTRPYHARLLRIAMGLCRDRDQAADLTQEALIRAFRAFDRFRPDQPVLPWLARILRNVYLDSLKTGRARHEVAAHQLPERDGEDLASRQPCPTGDPLRCLERAQLARLLTEELEQLPADQRLVVLLCDVEQMSYQEAAEVAGVPVGTVRSRLSRARSTLRDRIQKRMKQGNSSAAEVVSQMSPRLSGPR